MAGTATITPDSGGTIRLNDEAILTVPQKTLKNDAEIRIERVKSISLGDGDGLSPFGQAYRLTTSDTTIDTSSPLFLEISYDYNALKSKGFTPETIQLYYYDENLKQYLMVYSRIDQFQRKIVAFVDQFCIYVPMARTKLL